MFSETFKQSSVISNLNENFISIKVDTDKERDLAMQYGIRGLPVVWFISEKGEIIGSRPGFLTADQLLKILELVNTEPKKEQSGK